MSAFDANLWPLRARSTEAIPTVLDGARAGRAGADKSQDSKISHTWPSTELVRSAHGGRRAISFPARSRCPGVGELSDPKPTTANQENVTMSQEQTEYPKINRPTDGIAPVCPVEGRPGDSYHIINPGAVGRPQGPVQVPGPMRKGK
jgi:hypothetical protein